MFGKIALPPDGTHFLLIIMVVIAIVVGNIFAIIRLPALLGMLITGIVLKNIPGVTFDDHWPDYSKVLRGVALVVILLRAGLGLDPVLFPGVYLFHGHWYYLVVSYHFGKHWMRKQNARSDF